jgi:DNA-3-methyladenine glycosylase II
MTTFEIARPVGFRLEAAAEFYAGFVPGSGMATAEAGGLALSFRVDATFDAVAVALREEGKAIVGQVAGGAPAEAVKAQVARMLGLEEGCERWPAVGERDPVVGRLQAEYPGFHTAAKASPYDAAVWAVIAQRSGMAQAARTKKAIARDLGDAVELGGAVHHVFPSPERLAGVHRIVGVPDEKVARLRGVASAALSGKLDATHLRAMGEEAALVELQTLRGIGPWAASHVFFRGAAPTDGLPLAEPRVLHGFARAYGLDAPSWADFLRAAEAWRPFRMWVCVLLARHLAKNGAWSARGLTEERRAAARAMTGYLPLREDGR